MAKINPNIILLGIQGSGKSTQAEMLATHLRYNWIVTGTLVRNAIKSNNKNSKIINDYVKQGKLVPNELMFKYIYKPYLDKVDKTKGIIFDGMPRNIEQMNIFHKLLEKLNISKPILIYLYVPDKIVKQRILSRKVCPKCDKAYQPTDAEYKNNICSKCKVKLIARNDDTDQNALAQRISIFHNDTKKIINYYKKQARMIKIDGTATIPQVQQEILQKIKPYFK